MRILIAVFILLLSPLSVAMAQTACAGDGTTADLACGLVGKWSFDDLSGNQGVQAYALDTSGNNNVALLVNSPAWTTGVVGSGALYFNSANLQYASLPIFNGLPVYNTTNPYSISFWVTGPTVNGSTERIYNEGSTASQTAIFTITQSGSLPGKISVYIDNGSAQVLNKGSSKTVFGDGNWHHIVWTDNAGQAALYIDGVQDPNNFNYVPSPIALNNATLGADKLSTGVTANFTGMVDDLRIYNRALGQTDINALYALGTGSKIATIPTAPPVISNGIPVGPQPVSQNITLGITTNEAATCKYSATPNVIYAAMANTFTTTGGTTHSSTIEPPQDRTAQFYYVKCVDGSGNEDLTDYIIGYSGSNLASAPDGLIPADKRIDWGQAGVPGGIPNRTTICANVTQPPYNAPYIPYNAGIVPTIIATATVNSGGTGYNMGDELNIIQDGGSGGIVQVATVNSGVIKTVNIINPGTGYMGSTETTAGLSTTDVTGTGTGATFNITINLINPATGAPLADAGPAIQSAINACGCQNYNVKNCPYVNQVVYIPEGIYSIQTPIGMGPVWDGSNPAVQSLSIRGDGPGKTVLVAALSSAHNGSPLFSVGTDDSYSSKFVYNPILSGYIQGSSSIAVTNASNVSPGMFLNITDTNEPGLVYSTGGYLNQLRQLVYVTNVNTSTTPNTISFTPPLYWTFKVDSQGNPPSYAYRWDISNSIGFEDFTISHSNGYAGQSILMQQCYGCWLKGIESNNAPAYHIYAVSDLAGEIRDSYIHDEQGTESDHGGIIFYQDNDSFLVDNNILAHTFPQMEISGSSDGNVFSYNYSDYGTLQGGLIGTDLDANHNPHNIMNLWEGNRAIMFQGDGYYGSASDNTVFRNWFTGTYPSSASPTSNQNRKVVSLNRYTYYFNLIGNVLGTFNYNNTGYPGLYNITTNGYSYGQPVIYQLGYPNIGNNGYTGTNTPGSLPVANSQNLTALENTSLPITLSGMDYYGNSLTYSVVAAPTNGTLSGSGESYTYTPNNGFNGTDVLVFKVNNGLADSNIAYVPIDVVALSSQVAPYANNQDVTFTDVDQPDPITLTAIDLNNKALTYTLVSIPPVGEGTVEQNGEPITSVPHVLTSPNITYTPGGGYVNAYTITFDVSNGTNVSNTATVFINVTDDNALDLTVSGTLERHGNFDYVTNSTIWDPNISNQTLPPSLYLTAAYPATAFVSTSTVAGSITCGSPSTICNGSSAIAGNKVVFYANPIPGYALSGWTVTGSTAGTDCGTTAGTCTVTFSVSTTVTADFVPAAFGSLNLSFPPFGPSTNASSTVPTTGLIPAEQCFQNENLANGGQFDAAQCYYLPAVPTDLIATAGNAQVSLSWTSWSGAASYNVYRGTSAGAESTTPIATSVTATSYTDPTSPDPVLINGTTYYYVVKAVNTAGTSGSSNEASATPSTILYGDVNGDGQVTIYDAELTAQYAVGIPVSSFNATAAEVDGNSSVDIYDAYLIAKYAVGLITKFPVQQ